MRYLILTLYFLSMYQCVYAQYGSDYNVVSEDNDSPVLNAYVYNKSTCEGTIVDEGGYFEFDKEISGNDTIIVTCLGFEQVVVSGSFLKDNRCVRMKAITYALEEVIARPKSAVDIVKKVRELFYLNYPNDLCRYKLHVEHLLSSVNKKLTRFSGDVVCSISGYQKDEPGEYRLLSYNEFENHKGDLGFTIPYRFDIFPDQLVENSLMNKLNFLKETKKYQYIIDDSDVSYIRLSFKPIKVTSKYRFEGYMLINPTTYAIEYLEYEEAPDMYQKKDIEVYVMSYFVVPMVKTKGIFTCRKGKTRISFMRMDGKYHIGKMSNEYTYRYESAKGECTDFSAINEIDNTFGVVSDVEALKQINMSLYNLEEWDYNELKLSENERKKRAKYEKYIKKIREAYPELEI